MRRSSNLRTGTVAPVTASSLALAAQFNGDTVTVFVSGEVDVSNVDALDDLVRHVLDAGSAVLCVDMTDVRFCESVTFHVLINAAAYARACGSRLVTAGLQAYVMRVVDILDLRTPLGVQASQLAA